MNLLAKRLRQLAMLSVALFFFSCEDENSIIGYRNPKQKFQVTTIEIPLQSSVVLLDSIVTDNKQVQSYITLVGAYNDNMMGPVKAESYLQIIPAFNKKIDGAAVFDSVVFQSRLNYYTYGLTSNHQEQYSIHLITGDTLNRLSNHSYYSNSSVAYDPNPLGFANVSLNAEEVKRQYALSADKQDTLLTRGRLSDDFGNLLLSLSKTHAFTKDSTRKFFLNEVKGLSLIPSESSTIFALDLTSAYSGVFLYYHTGSDTLAASFVFNPASFTNISTDRTGTELAGLAPYQAGDPASGNRYVQSGAAVATKVDLTNFYAFADTTENIVINEAEFIIDNVESPVGTVPHASLRFRFMDENNNFSNIKIAEDRTAFSNYHYVSEGFYYSVQADVPSQQVPYSLISYDSEGKRFSGYMTFFAQSLFRNKNDKEGINESRLKYIALYPYSPVVSRSVNRTVFHKENIKLKITYTRPTQSNPE